MADFVALGKITSNSMPFNIAGISKMEEVEFFNLHNVPVLLQMDIFLMPGSVLHYGFVLKVEEKNWFTRDYLISRNRC